MPASYLLSLNEEKARQVMWPVRVYCTKWKYIPHFLRLLPLLGALQLSISGNEQQKDREKYVPLLLASPYPRGRAVVLTYLSGRRRNIIYASSRLSVPKCWRWAEPIVKFLWTQFQKLATVKASRFCAVGEGGAWVLSFEVWRRVARWQRFFANTRIMSQTRSRLLPSRSFPLHYSFIISSHI